MTLKDKVIVITGGSCGIGRGLAEALISEGAKVVISGNNETELQDAARAVGAEAFVADSSDFEVISGLAEHVRSTYGRIDIWINNAGVQIAPSSLEDVEVAKLQQLFAVNFFGYFFGCKAVLPIMKQQHQGLIVNINSTAGLAGKPGLSAYVASKFAVKGMSESIRAEAMGSGVELYEVFPGGVQTDIYHEKVPADFNSYMPVGYAVSKIVANLQLETPEQDLIIRRPGL